MSFPLPTDDPNAWRPVLGERLRQPVPGFVLIRGCNTKFKLDKHSGPGINGGRITFQGTDFSTFDMVVRIPSGPAMRLDWEVWQKIVGHLLAIKKTPNVVSVFHPVLAMHSITKCFVEEIHGPEQEGQVLVTTVSFTKWAPLSKVNATKTPAGPATGADAIFPTKPGTSAPSAYVPPTPPSATAPKP